LIQKLIIHDQTMSDDRAEFNESARRSFLLGIKHSKKKKAKEAEKRAKETLRKVRAERRHQRKEERETVVKELVEKQAKLGIRPTPLLADGNNVLLFAEVDAANPTEVKLGEMEVKDNGSPPQEMVLL
jgi:hypothetical protein